MRTVWSSFDQEENSDLCDDVFMLYAEIQNTIAVADMSDHERVISLVWHFGGIIDNGGFGYLYCANITGDPHYRITADSFRVIGCEQIVSAFAASFAWFSGGVPPADVVERRRQLALVSDDEKSRVDCIFYAQSGRLGEHLGPYIRAHRVEIEKDLRARLPRAITRRFRIWRYRLRERLKRWSRAF